MTRLSLFVIETHYLESNMEKVLSPFLCKDLIKLCYPFVYDMLSAASAGDLEALKHLVHLNGPLDKWWTISIAIRAIRGDHFMILKWLKDDLIKMSQWDKCILVREVAFEQPHLRWLRYLDQILALDEEMCKIFVLWAPKHNSTLNAIKYLYSKNKLGANACRIVLHHYAFEESMKVFKWATMTLVNKVSADRVLTLLTTSVVVLTNKVSTDVVADVINYCVSSFDTISPKVVKWFCYHYKPCYVRPVVANLARAGKLELAQWVHKTFHIVPDADAYHKAIIGGHTDVLTWIKEINPCISVKDCPNANWNPHWHLEEDPDLKIIKWLHKNEPSILENMLRCICGYRALKCQNFNNWIKENYPHLCTLLPEYQTEEQQVASGR